ncbi:hypothetical protein UFOVP75_117 [uncultured Caudovirales phage]|uniref:Uncharacterized protein n=1 Tax=uncultured Caudovirales phage TaxID=2100421 RepID=A0A6J5L5V7_9CAUD|nr:hypothetical protein UFOVP75_117 [uncultured Caudovirales phage]
MKKQKAADDHAAICSLIADMAADEAAKSVRSKNRRTATLVAKDSLFASQLEIATRDAFSDASSRIPFKPYTPKKKLKTDRVLNLLWSDLHFHSLLDPREVPIPYGPVEEARRLAALCVQAAEYKRDHRDSTSLVINIAGDIIQNQLHDPRDGAPLAEQYSAALYLLVQAIGFLATEFKKVDVYCTPGNHGRNTARHHDRAMHQKWDSIENMLYFSIKVALSHVKNVVVNCDYKPYYIYSNFGMNTLVTHGDTVIKPGYPGSNIDVSGIRKQINEFNASRDDKVGLFCVGHVHVGSLVHLPNKTSFMSNGALIPIDPYAQSVGVFNTTCGQQMWESVPGRLVGDSRFVIVDEETDKDKSLDKIIRPFLGFHV